MVRYSERSYLRQPRLQPHGLGAHRLARLLVLGHDPIQLGVALFQDLALLAEGGRVRLGDLEALRVVLLLQRVVNALNAKSSWRWIMLGKFVRLSLSIAP